MQASVDTYNVLNRSDILQHDNNYVQATWLKPAVILVGRYFKGSLRVEF